MAGANFNKLVTHEPACCLPIQLRLQHKLLSTNNELSAAVITKHVVVHVIILVTVHRLVNVRNNDADLGVLLHVYALCRS